MERTLTREAQAACEFSLSMARPVGQISRLCKIPISLTTRMRVNALRLPASPCWASGSRASLHRPKKGLVKYYTFTTAKPDSRQLFRA